MQTTSFVHVYKIHHNTTNDSAADDSTATGGSELRLRFVQFHLRHQTFDALLELAVLRGIDERIDTAVDERQHYGEVVEPVHETVNVNS